VTYSKSPHHKFLIKVETNIVLEFGYPLRIAVDYDVPCSVAYRCLVVYLFGCRIGGTLLFRRGLVGDVVGTSPSMNHTEAAQPRLLYIQKGKL
jgi:hypothetical protein